MKQGVAVQGPGSTVLAGSRPRRAVPGAQVGKGITRIVKAATRAPMKFTVAMAQGAHNTPKLWGDKTVRPSVKVSGIASGISAGCQVSQVHPSSIRSLTNPARNFSTAPTMVSQAWWCSPCKVLLITVSLDLLQVLPKVSSACLSSSGLVSKLRTLSHVDM